MEDIINEEEDISEISWFETDRHFFQIYQRDLCLIDSEQLLLRKCDKQNSITVVDWSAPFLWSGLPFQQTSTGRRVEVACPKTAHTQRS